MKKIWNWLLDWIMDFDIWPREIGWKWYSGFGVLNKEWMANIQ